MKTIDAVSAKSGIDKSLVKQAMEHLFEKGCISQYVRKLGRNEVKLLKVDYKLCEKLGYLK